MFLLLDHYGGKTKKKVSGGCKVPPPFIAIGASTQPMSVLIPKNIKTAAFSFRILLQNISSAMEKYLRSEQLIA